ncbi:ATP-binding cassette domain-containing protein [Staphylococcus simulans]
MTNTLMQIKHLNITDKQQRPLIQHLNLTIYEGKVNVLIGESGSGKSLTASTLIGQTPRGLQVTYDQFYFKNQTIHSIQSLLGKQIGYISQDYAHSFNNHTRLGKQLSAIYRMHYPVSKQVARKQIERALKWVNLDSTDILAKYRFMLSGGQLERLYIASVLMLEPDLIIADEPVASLDVLNGQRIMKLIKHLAEVHNTTLLLITHNLTHVIQYADEINVIKEGTIIESGPVSQFKEGQINDYTKQLLNARSRLTRKEDTHD